MDRRQSSSPVSTGFGAPEANAGLPAHQEEQAFALYGQAYREIVQYQ